MTNVNIFTYLWIQVSDVVGHYQYFSVIFCYVFLFNIEKFYLINLKKSSKAVINWFIFNVCKIINK